MANKNRPATDIANTDRPIELIRIVHGAICHIHVPLETHLNVRSISKIVKNAEGRPNHSKNEAEQSGKLRDSHVSSQVFKRGYARSNSANSSLRTTRIGVPGTVISPEGVNSYPVLDTR